MTTRMRPDYQAGHPGDYRMRDGNTLIVHHAVPVEDTFAALGVTAEGLSQDDGAVGRHDHRRGPADDSQYDRENRLRGRGHERDPADQ